MKLFGAYFYQTGSTHLRIAREKMSIYLSDFMGLPMRLGKPSLSSAWDDMPGGGGGGGGGAKTMLLATFRLEKT